MPRIEPSATPLSEPFWEATRSKQLLVQRCEECGAAVWYPRERCSSCLGDQLRWTESTGDGTVYAFNVMRRPGNPMMADEVPYVLALVDLDEGYRMATNIVGCGAPRGALRYACRGHVGRCAFGRSPPAGLSPVRLKLSATCSYRSAAGAWPDPEDRSPATTSDRSRR